MNTKSTTERTVNKWSLKYDSCVSCGTKERSHKARGLCYKCYDTKKELDHRGVRRRRGDATKKMTRDFLVDRYVNMKNSLGEIAKECGCTRQLVCIRMKEHGIPLRSKKDARSLALHDNKITYPRQQDDGSWKGVTLNVQQVNNENFFKTWSPEMAYVLGIIYTDGHINPGRLRDPLYKTTSTSSRLTITQKEPELLEKVLQLMGCTSTLHKRKRREYNGNVAGEVYYFHIHSETFYEELIKLGVTANKSKVLTFPEMPDTYIRHFIRGCWDGDGSFYFSGGKLQASFVSGSKEFIEGLNKELFLAGIVKSSKERKHGSFSKVPLAVHKSKKSNSYSIKLTTNANMEIFYKLLYDGVEESMYLTRKYNIVMKGLGLDKNSQDTKRINKIVLRIDNLDESYRCSVCGAVNNTMYVTSSVYCDMCRGKYNIF